MLTSFCSSQMNVISLSALLLSLKSWIRRSSLFFSSHLIMPWYCVSTFDGSLQSADLRVGNALVMLAMKVAFQHSRANMNGLTVLHNESA